MVPLKKLSLCPKAKKLFLPFPGFDLYGCGECHQPEKYVG